MQMPLRQIYCFLYSLPRSQSITHPARRDHLFDRDTCKPCLDEGKRVYGVDRVVALITDIGQYDLWKYGGAFIPQSPVSCGLTSRPKYLKTRRTWSNC